MPIHGHAVGALLGLPFSGARAGDCLSSAHAHGEEVPALDVAQGLRAFLCLKEEQGSLQGAPRALEVCGTRAQWHRGAHPLAALLCSPHLPSLVFLVPGSLCGAVARYRYPLCATGCVISL